MTTRVDKSSAVNVPGRVAVVEELVDAACVLLRIFGGASAPGHWATTTSRHGLIAAVRPGVWVAADECDAPRRTHGSFAVDYCHGRRPSTLGRIPG